MSERPDPPAATATVTGGEPLEPDESAGGTPSKRDLVLVHGRTEDGTLRVIRSREDRLEVGEMRAPKEGQPITGELVQLRPTEEHDQLFECETLFAPPRSTAGPAQVASEAYRVGWEQIFGGASKDDPPPDPN